MDKPRPLRILLMSDEGKKPISTRGWVVGLGRLAQSFTERGCNVTVAVLRGNSEIVEGLAAGGTQAFGVDFVRNGHAARATARLIRVIRERDIDLVVGREVIPAILAGTAARVARTGAISEFVRYHTYGGADLNLASRMAGMLCHHTVVPSASVASYARAIDHTPEERIHLMYLGRPEMRPVSDAEVDELKLSLGIPRDAPVAVVVARLRHEKGVDLAVEAFTRPETAAAHLVVVGTGPEEVRVAEAAAAKLGRRGHLVGHQDDVAPWFALADVVVVPSRKEALGLVPIEAMSASRPVVAADVGGMAEEVVEGETGVLVPAESTDALGRAVGRLLADPAARAAMGAAGRARYDELFTWDAMIDRWVGIWRRVLGPRFEYEDHRRRSRSHG